MEPQQTKCIQHPCGPHHHPLPQLRAPERCARVRWRGQGPQDLWRGDRWNIMEPEREHLPLQSERIGISMD